MSQFSGMKLIKKADKVFQNNERLNAEKTWKSIARFILPNHNTEFMGNATKGIRDNSDVFSSHPEIMARDLASAMHSTITNPSTKWSKLSFRDEALNDDRDGSVWLEKAKDMIHSFLNESNFDSQIGTAYQSFVAFGAFCLLQEEVESDHGSSTFNFQSWHIAELAWCENKHGLVDTVYRKFKLTIKQAFDKFGYEVMEDYKEKLGSDPDQELEFYHCIYPRDKNQIQYNDVGLSAPEHRPFASVYIRKEGAVIVKEDGYYEQPFYIARFSKRPGEIYSYGPGHVALADTKTLNKVREQNLKAMAKAINPTIVTETNNVVSGDRSPGKMIVVRDLKKIQEWNTNTRFDIAHLEVEELKESIKSAFYLDKLMLPPRTETGEMTAYEIAQRLEEMQRILGPTLSRLNTEFLTLLVMRSLSILIRNRQLPPLPDSVVAKVDPANQGNSSLVNFEVMFVNSLARSQQTADLRNIQTWLQDMAAVAQLNPEVLDNIDYDAVARYESKIKGIPEMFLKDSKVVAQIRQQRQQQQQMAAALQAGQAVGGIAKDVSSAAQ